MNELRVPLDQRFLIVNESSLSLEVIAQGKKFVIPVHGHMSFQPEPWLKEEPTLKDWDHPDAGYEFCKE